MQFEIFRENYWFQGTKIHYSKIVSNEVYQNGK
jgi:hypothetical protein